MRTARSNIISAGVFHLMKSVTKLCKLLFFSHILKAKKKLKESNCLVNLELILVDLNDENILTLSLIGLIRPKS
jgi:hypothetical protein